MHIFFSGIGGTAIGPLAHIAQQAGFTVSGSDKQDSLYIDYLKKHGVTDIHIGQTREQIAAVHKRLPIDWYVYSSAVTMESAQPPELAFCQEQGITVSKRDEMINLILQKNKFKLIAVAGTHGKTTTTSMIIWLFKQLEIPLSYSVGAKISFGDMGEFHEDAEYFAYECDEFDRNFLAFEPHLSIISGVTWDHHEIFPTREDYQQAFQEFISQSDHTILWQEDAEYLGLRPGKDLSIQDSGNPAIHQIKLAGQYNRLDGWLVIQAVHRATKQPVDKLIQLMSKFPGVQRRMEQIIPNLYSDYAHTPEKIRGGMSVALEMAEEKNQNLVVIYEPLTNRRQHYMLDDYGDCFSGASKLYWTPSYLAREDQNQRIIPPEELISHLPDQTFAQAAKRDQHLKKAIQKHLDQGNMVVAMAGGGGGSLDEWIRGNFSR
ncbi:MAG TPA: Mur ligase domain-containing protein [Candidatus Limnocylindria bacterium]|nr:Mur ligase domain-containing protein [Candidatus Limnocylindria bacterium]